MALPNIFRKLFKSNGYGPLLKDEIVSRHISVQNWSNAFDYPVATVARGADGVLYYSVAQSGPNTGAGAVDPTADDGTYWGTPLIPTMPAGDNSQAAATTSFVGSAINIAVPVGTVLWSAGSATPSGYLLCNGAAVGRATYPDLFAAIGATYGAGDGSTTFNLPNIIDRFPQGNATPGTVKAAGLPNITGEWATVDMGGRETYSNGAIIAGTTNLNRAPITSSGGHTMYDITLTLNASKSSAVYGNSSTVQPPALTLLPCIKY